MVLHVSSEKLDVFEEPILDHSLASLHEYTYKPYGSPYFKNSDIVHIPINFQDLILNIADSYIFIEGTFTPSDATKSCYLSNNALSFLFDEISLHMGGEKVVIVRNPGITSTMKTMISHGKSAAHSLLCTGWGLNEDNSAIWDSTSKVFSGRIPLKHIMGFAEDYKKGILNIKQELVLVIARSFKNCFVGECDAELSISKIEWKVQQIVPEDRYKVKLLQRLNKSSLSSRIKVAFRSWDLYELPSLRSTSTDVWAIRTTNKLERPLFVIVGFQDSKLAEDPKKDITKFIHANINSIRLKLNNQVYPYERWNLDFEKKLNTAAYYAFESFQSAYYNKGMAEPLFNIKEFNDNPLFVIDCSHQPDNLQLSTVDISLEFETRKSSFPANTKVYALIIHDSCISYNAFDGSIQNGLIHSY